jgi:ribosomal protein S18 acetylase RimI-like enzyme
MFETRKMTKQNVRDVVAVHLASFAGFFLSFLGPRFLSTFYAGVCSDPDGISLVCINTSGNVSAFIVGTVNPRGFYSRLLRKDWLKFSLASLPAVMRKPSIIKRVARAVFHPSENPGGPDVAGLLSIGVLPECQGSGVGRILVNRFLEEAAKRGCARVFLTTDRDKNDATNAFYKNLGFIIGRQYRTREGRNMNEYWIDISARMTEGER